VFNHYFMEFIVTAKKICVPDAVINENSHTETPIKHQQSYSLNPSELEENISRLSKISYEKISFSMILNYLKLFMRKRLSHLVVLSIIMASIFLITQKIPLMIENSTSITRAIFQITNVIIASFIGIKIIRLTILNSKYYPQSNFLKGYIPFIMLHFTANAAIIITLFIANHLFYKFNNTVDILSYKSLICGAFVASVISSTIFARFCLMIPAMIADNEDTFQTLALKTNPYFRFLFILFFCAKMICLNSFIFLDQIQIQIHSDNIIIVAKTILFTIYHVFIYILIGICYKLLIKNNHS
jgi:hypothetical protein